MIADPLAARRTAAVLAGLLALCGCDAAKTPLATQSSGSGVGVTVAPSAFALGFGQAHQFTATVTGDANTAVTWEVQEGSPGGGSVLPTSGNITTTYTAPSLAGTYHVVARSVADTSATGRATVVVSASAPISVTITTVPPASLAACATLAFAATVNNSANQAVTWTVQEGATGGSFTGGNVYHAPATGGTWHVVATSQADVSKTSSVAVTTVDEVVTAVTVSPGGQVVAPSGTQPFTATVTTSCGTFAATRALAVPGGAAQP
jgi:hypothetical protein